MSEKILFASSATKAWGAERSLWTLAQALVKQGKVVSLVSCDSELVSLWRVGLGEAELIPPVAPGILGFAQWWREFRRIHLRLEPETTVVVFSLQLAPLAWALRTKRRSRRPTLILDLHDYLTTARGRRKIRFFAKAFDNVISVSDFAAKQLSNRTRFTVLTRPVEPSSDTPIQQINASGAGPIKIGLVGRLDPDKNIEFAFEVVSRLHDSFHLVLRGSGSPGNENYALQLVSQGQKRLGNRVLYQGHISSDRVMDGLDVLLVVNHSEAMGRTVLEGQLAGVPVVVPNLGGAVELVSPGVTGYVYEAGSLQSTAKAIEIASRSSVRFRTEARRQALIATDPARYAERYLTEIQVRDGLWAV
jgi:glycosyltransferase involved in cell wall biosynthesis